MDRAIKVFSRQGNFKQEVNAQDIKSRQSARQLGPFVDPESKVKVVSWISPCFEDGSLTRRSHFRKFAEGRTYKFDYQSEEIERRKFGESPEHKKAKLLIAEALKENLKFGRQMPWYFNDPANTDLLLSGNYLAGASEIETEYYFKTSLHNEFRLDIAILSQGLVSTASKFIIGAIEIERSHTFGYRKEILCKSAGFPLVSIDISEMKLDEITKEWAHHVLSETTINNTSGFRSNYLYLHHVLYPVYANFPDKLLQDDLKHQYIIFDNNSALLKTQELLKKLFKLQSVSGLEPHMLMLNRSSSNAETILVNIGEIVGFDWESVNSNNALLITLKRMSQNNVLDLKFNLAVIRTLLKSSTALIGYKFQRGAVSDGNKTKDIWSYSYSEAGKNPYEWIKKDIRILPKRLGEPLQNIIEVLNQFI